MKLYIVGPVASGKSTLARKISEKTGIPCYHLDEVVYEEDPTDSWGNRKRPLEERDRIFSSILAQPDFIIEDAGRECFLQGMALADTVLLLEFSPAVRRRRIVLRWLKQNLGIEKTIYRPKVAVLRAMFRWTRNYDSGADGVKGRIAEFGNKTRVLAGPRDVRRYLQSLPGGE